MDNKTNEVPPDPDAALDRLTVSVKERMAEHERMTNALQGLEVLSLTLGAVLAANPKDGRLRQAVLEAYREEADELVQVGLGKMSLEDYNKDRSDEATDAFADLLQKMGVDAERHQNTSGKP